MRLIAFTIVSTFMSFAAFADSVDHAMGTTEVPGDPQRIVVLTNEGTEALLALGITPVGAAQSWTGDPWYDHIQAQMGDAAPLGKENQINLELVTALEPDLILANKQRHEEIYTQLSTIAPTIVSQRLRGDWRTNFELYARAVGKPEAGTELLADFDTHVQELSEALGGQVEEQLSVIRFMPGHIRIYQKDSFSGFILDEVGFARPELQDVDEFAMRVGKESIPQMGGDRIVYFTYDAGDGEGLANAENALSDPLWQALPAVRRGDVVPVDDAIWNTAGGILAAHLMLDDIARIYNLD